MYKNATHWQVAFIDYLNVFMWNKIFYVFLYFEYQLFPTHPQVKDLVLGKMLLERY